MTEATEMGMSPSSVGRMGEERIGSSREGQGKGKQQEKDGNRSERTEEKNDEVN